MVSYWFRNVVTLVLAVFVALTVPSSAQAQAGTILTVVIEDETIALSREEMEAMGSGSFVTTTIWTDGEQEFTGVPLSDFAAAFGIERGTLRAHAVNDYIVDIPMTDAVEGGPIIAHTRNGAPMSVRDNGPLWIVYPYDRNPDYRSEVIYARSIWQLDRIEVLP